MKIQQYVDDIKEANLQTLQSTHCMISQGRANSINSIDTLTHLTKDEAMIALEIGIKIGYSNTFQYYHGAWKDEYGYNPIISKSELEEFLNDSNHRNTFMGGISIDPAYDLINAKKNSQDLLEIIKEVKDNITQLKREKERSIPMNENSFIIDQLDLTEEKPTLEMINNIYDTHIGNLNHLLTINQTLTKENSSAILSAIVETMQKEQEELANRIQINTYKKVCWTMYENIEAKHPFKTKFYETYQEMKECKSHISAMTRLKKTNDAYIEYLKEQQKENSKEQLSVDYYMNQDEQEL